MPKKPRMPTRIAGTVRELRDKPMTLGAVDLWVPKPQNQDRVELTVSTDWLLRQTCPEHPFAVYYDAEHNQWRGWTHCLARFAPLAGGRFRRPSVVFSCPPTASRPQGHLYEVVFEGVQ